MIEAQQRLFERQPHRRNDIVSVSLEDSVRSLLNDKLHCLSGLAFLLVVSLIGKVDLGTSLPTGLDFHLQNLGFLGSIRTFSVQLHLFRGAAVQVF